MLHYSVLQLPTPINNAKTGSDMLEGGYILYIQWIHPHIQIPSLSFLCVFSCMDK